MFKQKQIVEKGIIKHICGNRALVEIVKQDTEDCKSCGVCVGIKNSVNQLEVDTIPGVNVGHRVLLQIAKPSPYKSMFLLLIFPIINLLIGSFIGQKIPAIYPYSQNMRMLFCGFIFFASTFALVSIYDKKIKNKKHTHRKIISIEGLNNFSTLTR